MLDIDWPAIARSLEQWLDPTNFDPLDQQKTRLEDFREAK